MRTAPEKRLWGLFSPVLLCLFLLTGALILALAPAGTQPALADPSTSLEITGDGVETPMTLTMSQLQGMEQYQQVYSVINTWPTKKLYVGKGVKVKDVLNKAGLLDTAKLLKFTAQDGYTVTLTVQELLETERYYFPNFKSGGDSDGNTPGSAAGAKPVEPILALLSVEGSDDAKYMNGVNALLLMLGQRAVTEQTGNLFVKYINKIEVLTAEPEKWDAPQANPGSGTVPAGTMVTLSNVNNDDDKIYYTTNGSEPTMDSPMYNWIAKRWWASRADVLGTINHPIGPINRTTTIKAVTIGPGKLNSDVVTFTYQVGEDPADTGDAAGTSDADIVEPAPVTQNPEPALPQKQKVIKLTIGQTEASIDGNLYTLETAPYLHPQAQRTLVPLRFVGEALGAAVDWQPESGQITIAWQDQEIILIPASTSVLVNGQSVLIDCAPEIQPPGRTFVPLRFISETLGAQVDYDEESETITITK